MGSDFPKGIPTIEDFEMYQLPVSDFLLLTENKKINL